MILLDSYYDSEENEVLFVKIRARFPDLISLLGPSFPKSVFRSQTLDVTAFRSKSFFMSNSIIFCMKHAFIFKFWVIFDKVMSVYSKKIAKHLSKIFLTMPFQIVLFKSCLKNILFWSTKIQLSPKLLSQI